VLWGGHGGGDIAPDTIEAIADERSWGQLRGAKGRGYRQGKPL